jgi:putative endonuclease
MTLKRKDTGLKGEKATAEYLLKKGYRIICRNYECPLGEIDLIVKTGQVLVFVEVRTRTGVSFGLPQESVTWRKQQKLRQLAWYYLKAHGETNTSCRFDVVAVILDRDGLVKNLEHIIDAF